MPVYNEKYIKATVRKFNDANKVFGNKIPKESMNYACIACITNDSVMRMEKKKLSTGLFTRMQTQNEKEEDDQIHKS